MADRPGQFYVNMPGIFEKKIRRVDSTQVSRFWAELGWKRIRSDPDGLDRTCQRCQIRGLVAPRISVRVGIV